MFEYKKALKKVEHLETLINAIKHDENNSGYRVEVNFGHGKLYEDNTESYGVDIYVLSNYKNYNEQGKTIRFEGVYHHELEHRLPCDIVGNPIESRGEIQSIEFHKDELLKALEDNKDHLTDSQSGKVVKHMNTPDGTIIEEFNLYMKYITVHF